MVKFEPMLLSMFVSGVFLSGAVYAATQDPTAPLGWAAPTVPKSNSKSAAPKLPKLQSIMCVERCQAVVNDQVVTQGDKINGYHIRHITPEYVTLSRGGKRWQLELFSLDIKQ